MRFSGFDDEWQSCRFDELFDFQVAGDMKKELFNEEFIDEYKYPLYANALENEGLLGYYKEYKYNPNSITVTARGNIGHATARKNKFNAVGRLIILTPKEDLNIEFFTEYINNNVKIYIESTGVPQLTAPSLKINKLHYPTLNEQNKISNLLIMLNNKIELLGQKHQLYQYFKKYLMQQIFTQKLRFDFNDEWRIRILNEITFYQEGPGVRNYQYTKEGVKLLNVGNFVNNALELDNTDKYISNEEAYGKYKHFLVDEGDLLIACSGIKAEYFDEKIAFAENKHLPLCMNTSTMRFKSLDENTLNLRYLKYYFQTQSFKKQVFQVMTGSAQFNFGPTHLKYFKIPIPCLDEQIKIYQMFESIDIKILNIYREIMKVKEFKKGLLQQMFIVRINWRCNFKLAKSPSFNKHLLILKNKIIFIIIE